MVVPQKKYFNMKILVTGGAGYIGSVLVRLLLNKGHRVRVIDSLKFGGESLFDVSQHSNFEFIKGDLRIESDLKKALIDIDGIAHLAAIVGDPACSKFSDEANETNWTASVNLFELAENMGIKKFVFASTCSNYGKMKDPNSFVDEKSELRPVSLYAKLKVKFEKFLIEENKNSNICATALRFSTVYGFSPRIRFDLTVNEFTRNSIIDGFQEIWGPQFNRAYCHVDDLARAVIAVLESKDINIKSNVYNVGDTSENYSKQMIMEEIQKQLPLTKVNYVEKNEDPRDYRVNCDKIKNELNFTITKKVPVGIKEIINLIKSRLVLDPYASKFKNI